MVDFVDFYVFNSILSKVISILDKFISILYNY